MNLKRFTALIFTASIGIIILSTTAYTNNNGRAGNTGSPGENACNQCHNTNALNSGGGSVSISSPNMPNWVYFPGTTYTINVKVKKAGIGKFGFGFEALLPSGANGGLIQTANSNNSKTLSATVLGNSRTNAVHKQPNHFGTDSVTFTFDWVAPAAGTGNITFYAAGNAANSANNSSGDFIYTTNQVITEASTVDINSQNNQNIVTIFPNPTTDYLVVNLPTNINSDETIIQFFDLKGSLKHSQKIMPNANQKNISLNVDFLNNGTYLMRLQNASLSYQQKIIVNK
jgi:hypothetical protein